MERERDSEGKGGNARENREWKGEGEGWNKREYRQNGKGRWGRRGNERDYEEWKGKETWRENEGIKGNIEDGKGKGGGGMNGIIETVEGKERGE